MSAARDLPIRIELADEQLDDLAERIAAKLRAPQPPAPRRSIKVSDTDRAAMRKVLGAMGLRPKRVR